MTTTECAARYRIEATTFIDWQAKRDFPLEAKRRISPGAPVEWNVDMIDDWLRSRPVQSRQRPARWWSVVGIAGYGGKATA